MFFTAIAASSYKTGSQDFLVIQSRSPKKTRNLNIWNVPIKFHPLHVLGSENDTPGQKCEVKQKFLQPAIYGCSP